MSGSEAESSSATYRPSLGIAAIVKRENRVPTNAGRRGRRSVGQLLYDCGTTTVNNSARCDIGIVVAAAVAYDISDRKSKFINQVRKGTTTLSISSA